MRAHKAGSRKAVTIRIRKTIGIFAIPTSCERRLRVFMAKVSRPERGGCLVNGAKGRDLDASLASLKKLANGGVRNDSKENWRDRVL